MMLCTTEKSALFSDALPRPHFLHDHGIEVKFGHPEPSWRRYKISSPAMLEYQTIIHNHKYLGPPTNNMNLLVLFAMFASIAYAQDGACILTDQTL
jgi:hypothetical protein